jgi:hypothetical protein
MSLNWKTKIFGGWWTGRIQSVAKIGIFDLHVYKVGKDWRWSIYQNTRWGNCNSRNDGKIIAEYELRKWIQDALYALDENIDNYKIGKLSSKDEFIELFNEYRVEYLTTHEFNDKLDLFLDWLRSH